MDGVNRVLAALGLAISAIVATQVPMALAAPSSVTIPGAPNCYVFPADNVWNMPVDTLTTHSSSAAFINSISATKGIHYDMDLPVNLVPGSQPKVAVTFDSADESDAGPYPVPPNALREGGDDHHVLIVDVDNCLLYEMYGASRKTDGTWTAGSGAIFNLLGNALRPAWWTSADGAGLPMVPGLLRYDEVAAGEIRHALRFTAPSTGDLFIWPARHRASFNPDPALPPMGARFRLKAGFDISGFSAANQVILRAIRKYGLILADNGLPWYLQGVPDAQWNDDDLSNLTSVIGSNLEAVDTSPMILDINSAQVLSAAPVAPTLYSLSPATGAGPSATFVSTFQDTNGAVNVLNAYMVVTASTPDGSGWLNPAGSCYLWYNGLVDELKLMNDGATSWGPAVNPGKPGTLQNGQCSMDSSGAAILRSGVTFTMTLPVVFKTPFMGTRKNVFLAAVSANGLGGAWWPAGNWLPAASGAQPVGGVVTAVASALSYSRVTLTYNGTVKLTNVSNATVNGPLQIVFGGLTAGVTLLGASGTYSGSPYLTVAGVASLAPAQSATVNVRFGNPANARITFTPLTYSGVF